MVLSAGYGSRRYEVRAVEHPNPARLRATVKAVSTDAANAGRFHIDTVDFYLSRSRRTFISEAARLFRDTADVIEGDVNRLITQLETYAKEREGKGARARFTLITDADKAEALKLGRHPDLVGEILRDLERFGLVGETTNKTIGYVAMTSRKMDDPLSLLILSGSGAGKSLLQDTLLKLCPDEDLVKLTSLTGEALFYMGQDALKHKVLALEEHAGAAGGRLRHPQSHQRQETGEGGDHQRPDDRTADDHAQRGGRAVRRVQDDDAAGDGRGNQEPVHHHQH